MNNSEYDENGDQYNENDGQYNENENNDISIKLKNDLEMILKNMELPDIINSLESSGKLQDINCINSITTLDGRYKKDTCPLFEYFSEYALVKRRYEIEIKYLKFLVKLLFKKQIVMCEDFTMIDYLRVKEIEKKINHDVKAIEYYLRDIVPREYKELIHFGLTSHDINDLSHKLNLAGAIIDVMLPKLKTITILLNNCFNKYRDLPMVSRTHGQIASPTTLGKELKVFSERITTQINVLMESEISCKFGGAVGNLNAHYVAIPEIDWKYEMDKFIEFNADIIDVINKIEYLDFINSGALIAKKKGYCRPKILKSKSCQPE